MACRFVGATVGFVAKIQVDFLLFSVVKRPIFMMCSGFGVRWPRGTEV